MLSVSEVRVRYAETDQMGVAYHANYLVWCEVGRTDFIRCLARRDGDLIVVPDLGQIFATKGGATGAVVPLLAHAN